MGKKENVIVQEEEKAGYEKVRNKEMERRNMGMIES